ncbi:MAG: indolepyruvate ferredoxin oxidoreductase subunit alpha [Candidatus Pacebacteria bacterium]|nr:indolepyruvate ferredoxin oxidoreductase subunit alpha [Candidatus Paceibacterota bacterium]
MDKLLSKEGGKKIILLGNEAIVRGALEAGVNFVSTYPGTPASEIGNTFFKIAKDAGVYFEFSTNEKVALEAGIGASFSSLKTLVAMKNFGLNVCLDALIPFVYTGTKGPTVIIVADDPSCHSSAQSEENTRPMDNLIHIPILEPSDPQECLDFVKLAFQISEKFNIPVMVRTTTRVAHQKMPVKISNLKSQVLKKGEFIKDVKRFVTLPPRVLEMKRELFEKIEKIRSFSEAFLKIEGKKQKIGIITSGVSYLYVKEALTELKLDLPVLKLTFSYPLAEKGIKSFIKNLKKVLVVEELEAHLEKEVERLAKQANCKLEVFGKNLLPVVGELKPEYVVEAVAKITGRKYKSVKYDFKALKRSPQLCPGCPYWLVISAIKKAVDVNKVIFGGEIGCYMLFGNSPVNLQDYLSCMGSSVGIAHGIKKALQFNSGQATSQKLITFVGDSSFFHSGIPALINTVFNKSNPLIIILNNETTAMTGHQPHPVSVGIKTDISIEKLVRACGVKHVKTIDPVNQKEFINTIKEFVAKDEVSVIISKHPCKFVVPKND